MKYVLQYSEPNQIYIQAASLKITKEVREAWGHYYIGVPFMYEKKKYRKPHSGTTL